MTADRRSRLDGAARAVLVATVLLLGLAYDKSVLFASAEPRWMILHVAVPLAAALACLARLRRGGRLAASQPVAIWAALLFCAWALISTVDAIDGNGAWWTAKHVAAGLGLFALVVLLRGDGFHRALVGAMALGLLLNGALGILQFHGVTDATLAGAFPPWARLGAVVDHVGQAAPPAATFVNRNLAASFSVAVLLPALALFLMPGRTAWRALGLVAVACGAVLLAYTRTRASWLAGGVALVAVAAWIVWHGPTRRLVRERLGGLRALPAAAALGVVVWAAALPTGLAPQAGGVAKLEDSAVEQMAEIADLDAGSVGFRLAYYANGARMALDNSVNGVGLGSFRAAYPAYHDAAMPTPRAVYNPGSLFRNLHNDILQMFVELGVVGGAAFVGVFAAVVVAGVRVLRRDAPPGRRLLVLGALGGLVGLLVNALFSFPFQTPTAGIGWALAGIVVGAALLSDAEPAGRALRVPGRAMGALGLAFAATAAFVAHDDLNRRESGQYLKSAWSRNAAQVEPDRARADIERAHAIYPWNTQVQETRAIIHLHDAGSEPVPPERIAAVVEDSLRDNPNSSYLLIGLAKIYAHLGLEAMRRDDAEAQRDLAGRLDTLTARLQRVAGFRAETDATAAYAALLRDDLETARDRLDRAAAALPPGEPLTGYVRRAISFVETKALIRRTREGR